MLRDFCSQPNLVGNRFSAKSIGLDQRAQLPSPTFDNGVTITWCSRGPWSPYRTGVSQTEAIPWHCLRIFFMRDTGSHQRVFAIWSCRTSLKFLGGGFDPQVWSLKSPNSHANGMLIRWRLWNYIFVPISRLNPYFQGLAGTTSMGVKGMRIDRRDLNPGHWHSVLY